MAREHEKDGARVSQQTKDGEPGSARPENSATPRKVTHSFKADARMVEWLHKSLSGDFRPDCRAF